MESFIMQKTEFKLNHSTQNWASFTKHLWMYLPLHPWLAKPFITLSGPVYSLFALCWWTPGLIDQVEEGVKVGGIELPIIRAGEKGKWWHDVMVHFEQMWWSSSGKVELTSWVAACEPGRYIQASAVVSDRASCTCFLCSAAHWSASL